MKDKKNKKVEEAVEQETPVTEEPAAEETAEQESNEIVITREKLEELNAYVKDAEAKRDEYLAMAQRTQADFDNFRRRNASVRADSYEEGKRDVITSLLPILDDFDRVAEAESKDEAWAEGVKLVHRKLTETLQKQGLCEVETDGDFDPNLHNAVMAEAVEGVEKGKIIAVFQKGYRVKDKIVRHSMVKVSE